MSDVRSIVCRPFSVGGVTVPAQAIADAVDLLGNEPPDFEARALCRAFSMLDGHGPQEAANRLMQRWRKAGLARFRFGKWRLRRGAWETMQLAAHDARCQS